MKEIISQNANLDYASFQVSSTTNSYEALIFCNGIDEKLDIGPLDQLTVHLPVARELCDFVLRPDASLEVSSWFTKSTLSRFLHVVNTPGELKRADEIISEIQQLEENRRFHIALYSKDNSSYLGNEASDLSSFNNADLTHQIKLENATSDATKSELLKAMDLRLTALKEELLASFSRATGATYCKNSFSDLALFAQHFGVLDLSISLSKLLELCPIMLQKPLNESVNSSQTSISRPSLIYVKSNTVEPTTPGVSMAKVALAEREISSESESYSDFSDTDSRGGEKSRLDSSLMHRIHTGRSSSHWSTVLNRLPATKKAMLKSNSFLTATGDNEIEHPIKKPECNASRMSVQDAISLFERRRKDETADIQRRKTYEASINVDDSALKRWSTGSRASFNYSSLENLPGSCNQACFSVSNHDAEEKSDDEVKLESSTSGNVPEQNEDFSLTESQQVASHSESTGTSNFMEFFDTSIDQKVELNNYQYEEKRDKIIRSKNTGSIAMIQAQIKPPQETLELKKTANTPRFSRPAMRPESLSSPRKPIRNADPAGKLKKEILKTATTKIASSKSSSPKTPGVLPIGLSTTKNETKPANGHSAVSRVSIPTRRRSQPPNSLVQSIPREEKPFENLKGNKTNSSTIIGTSGKDSNELSSKPSISNKHTKKSMVVPVESKPFLRKGSKIAKPKDSGVPKRSAFPKNGNSLVPHEENESNLPPALLTVTATENSFIHPAATEENETSTPLLDNYAHIKTEAAVGSSLVEKNTEIESSVAPLIADIQCDATIQYKDEVHGVSPVVPLVSRPRHSLSQMLQAENGESDMVEWGNIENPPSFVFHKDAPKGLKKLLKFARKSRGEGNSLGGSSPSISSECEEGGGGSSSKRAIDYRIIEDISSGSDNLSAGGTAKGMRSFFSLSSFRSSKSAKS